jgi:hypothetical protein
MVTKKKTKSNATVQLTEYTGLLAELPPVYPALFDPDRPPPSFEWLAAQQRNSEPGERWRKMVLQAKKELLAHRERCWQLLAEKFGIDLRDPGGWHQMATALAQRHVPAFQIEHALKRARTRRAKKPIKLNHAGTACLVMWSQLEKVKRMRPLDEDETEALQIVRGEVEARVKGKTIRALRKQLRDAMSAYWQGKETDFQRQYVEEVWPMMLEAWKQPLD